MTATPDRSGFYPPLWARRLFAFTIPVSYPLTSLILGLLMIAFIVEMIVVGIVVIMHDLLKE